MGDKLDLKKALKPYFTGSKKGWEEITLPAFSYLMVEGQGAPGGADYVAALEVLYPAAYGLKFFSKLELGRDYGVPPLEGLWWADDFAAYTQDGRREEWRWTLMTMVPEWITLEHFDAAVTAQGKKKPDCDFARVRLDTLEEGLSLQHLHIGPFSEERPKLVALHDEIMPAAGLTFNGQHHEIYLSDPRRTAPEKLRTVLRQPVKRG